MARMRSLCRMFVANLLGLSACSFATAAPVATQYPILFVTQFPISTDFATIGSVFANHRASMVSAARGGDLYIRYPTGVLRNLTAEAGYGDIGQQGANAIAVRDPAVHWNGTKAVFSMVVGGPAQQYAVGTWYWQLYEITGFGQGQTPVITRVANQPADYNNVQPTYASNGDLIFVSDRPRNGQRHLYPQHDEYESTPTPTGLWKLTNGGVLSLMQHSPSGSFTPQVDSFGRVIFTRWDHLQRDQQADAGGSGNFNWASEAVNAPKLANTNEVFPELRGDSGTSYGHRINNFFPWMINQDGTAEETLNHIGRHELLSYFNRSFSNDPNLREFNPAGRTNANSIENWLQMVEDPRVPGRYLAIDALEFATHASGQIVAMEAPPSRKADAINVSYLTPRSTRGIYDNGTPPADFTGHYRHPLPLSDGQIIAARSADPRRAGNSGTRANPLPRYVFRLHSLEMSAGSLRPVSGGELTGATGIRKAIRYYDPDVLVSYDGPLWELSPVEVRARSVPPAVGSELEAPETQAFALAGVTPEEFRQFLSLNQLALMVTRNATTRDRADRQQPYNLRVPGGTQTTGAGGFVYDIAWMQFMQGDQIRGIGGIATPTAGRRVLAQPMHEPAALRFMPPTSGAPPGAVKIAADGSVASLVPAQRAMSWQSTRTDGTPVVRERYWISAQAGEIRVCDGCHGVNSGNQAGAVAAQNPPEALQALLVWWKQNYDPLFKSGFD